VISLGYPIHGHLPDLLQIYQYPRALRYHKLIYPRGLVSRCLGRAARAHRVAAAAVTVRGHHDGLDSVPGTVKLARAVTELLQPGYLLSGPGLGS
jgi:hypothetical protein